MDARRDLAAMFLSKGWQVLRQELVTIQIQATKGLLYSAPHTPETDAMYRATVKVVDRILAAEKELFQSQQTQPETPPAVPSGDRYMEG